MGATTLDEYRKNVEKDAALARRFQPIFVAEPTVEDTVSILRGLKEKYEVHHGVRISDSAIVAAATLSNRYITDRFLPDKAIDLVDEAASRVRMAVDSKPEELDEIDRRVVQLKIEREALSKEAEAASKARLEKLEEELAELKGQSAEMTERWRSEKEKVSSGAQLREGLDRLRAEFANAQRRGDLQRASEIAYGEIPTLEKRLAEAEAAEGGEDTMTPEVVDAEQIAAVVSRWTGVPVEKMLEGERESCSRWRTPFASAWWAKRRPCWPYPARCGVREPACRTPTGPSAPSCSLAPRGSARPSSPRRWRNSCSTTSTPSPALI